MSVMYVVQVHDYDDFFLMIAESYVHVYHRGTTAGSTYLTAREQVPPCRLLQGNVSEL
jgi:hypothetical protein